MKKTAITAIISSLLFTLSLTANAQSETSIAAQTEISMAESARPVMTAPADYVPEPQEELVIEYAEPTGEQGRGDVINLDYYYHENSYPEYISYIAAYDKLLTEGDVIVLLYRAGLTDMSQENIDEILSIADDTCYFVFEQASYSYAEREEIYEQLRGEFPDLYVSLGYDTEDIIIYAPEGRTEECLEKLGGRFEGLVFVADSEGVLYDAAVGAPTGELVTVPEGGFGADAGGSPVIGADPVVVPVDSTSDKGLVLIISAIAAAVLIAGAAFLLLRRSRVKLNADGTATAAASLSKKDVEQLITDSAQTPSDELRRRIIK